MMAFKDGVGQVIELTPAGMTGIALTMCLVRMLPAFDNLGTLARRAAYVSGPPQLADNLIALGFINQGLNVNKHIHHRLREMAAIIPQFGSSP
jgi:hypothetical protein